MFIFRLLFGKKFFFSSTINDSKNLWWWCVRMFCACWVRNKSMFWKFKCSCGCCENFEIFKGNILDMRLKKRWLKKSHFLAWLQESNSSSKSCGHVDDGKTNRGMHVWACRWMEELFFDSAIKKWVLEWMCKHVGKGRKESNLEHWQRMALTMVVSACWWTETMVSFW